VAPSNGTAQTLWRGLGACALYLAAAGSAHALEETGRVGGIEFAVYAPDWTWQKRDANVLVVLENTGRGAADAAVKLSLPAGKEHHFAYAGPETLAATLEPGEIVRKAFTQIRALSGVPRQTYSLELTFESDGTRVVVPYSLRTIRGAAVGVGTWAIVFPVVIAGVWCLVFFIALRLLAGPGAWLRTGKAIEEAHAE